MSPGVTANRDTGNTTLTVRDSPASRSTLVNPTRRCGATTTWLMRCLTNTGTTQAPLRPPVLVTANVAVTAPSVPFGPNTRRLSILNVVYERPNPKENSGL